MNSAHVSDSKPSLRIRNIGILAHIDAGKTSITERVLHVAGVREHAGNVDEGTTATDYLNVERQHGITIKTAAVRFLHKGVHFHLLDTPGHVDFSAEVDRVLRVLDGAVIVLCAVSGVQVRTGFIASGCRAHHIPRIYFINKMDRRGANFFDALREIAGELGEPVLPLQIPTFEEYRWNGIVDLVEMHWYPASLDRPDAGSVAEPDIPAVLPVEKAPLTEESRRLVAEYREKLLDRASIYDDNLMEKIVNGENISPDEIRAALRGPIYRQEITPALCGSSFSDISSALLLDATIDYLPDPRARGCPVARDVKNAQEVKLAAEPGAPFSAYIFKTVLSADLDALAWIRVWSGTIREDMKVMAMPARKLARIQHLYGIHGADIEPVQVAAAGEIVGARLSYMEVGGTLCAPGLQILYESFKNPEPLVSIAVEPALQQELPKLREALRRFSLEDVSLLINEEKETGRITISGQGELHLDIVLERLQKEYGLRVRAGNPQVPKVERLKKPLCFEDEFVGDFGGEKLSVALGVSLENQKDKDENTLLLANGVRISSSYETSIRQAMETVFAVGPAGGWPVVGAKVVIENFVPPGRGDKRAETAVEAAASSVLRRAVNLAGSIVLVPIVQISVEVPDTWFGAALATLQTRGARIESVEDAGGTKSIVAYAPMENLFGYATSLRSLTEGRGIYQAKFDHYGSENEY
jgi:elongation factor G